LAGACVCLFCSVCLRTLVIASTDIIQLRHRCNCLCCTIQCLTKEITIPVRSALRSLPKMSFGAPGGGSVNYKPTPWVFASAVIFILPLDGDAPRGSVT
jgi:hypothetical protein